MIGPFFTHHSVCVNIRFIWLFCMEMMRFKSQYFQLRSYTPVFWKRLSFSRKSVSKLKYWKCWKFALIVTKKTCRSLKQRVILKIPSTIFLEPMLFLLALKWNRWEKASSSAKTKANPNFSVKPVERNNHSFLLSIWWVTFFKHLYSRVIMEWIRT